MPMNLNRKLTLHARLVDSDGSRSNTRARFRVVGFSVLAIVATLCLQACGGGKGSGSTTIVSVAITPTAITVPVNTQTNFTAVVKLSDSSTSTTTTVTWQVNGVAGGDSTVGTIVPSGADQLIGVYTAPSSVPKTASGGLQVGQVSITAVAQQTSSTTTTSGTVTSNTAVVTVGSGLGLTVSPTQATVPAGGIRQFSALLNGIADPSVTWSVTTVGDPAVVGSIDANGFYTAPASPPPGATVTISATDPAATAPAIATITILYSDHSLSGPYAFSYTGNDQSGFLAVAGSFVADGQGKIISGVEDANSFLNGVSTQVPISGTYTVGSDGRGTAKLSTGRGIETWQFALATSQHAQLIRFDTNATGGGTIDQQNLDALTNSPTVISGSYVFGVLGTDVGFNPLGIAGQFSADGAGNIPDPATPDTILDVNDNGIAIAGVITTRDRTLHGTYQFDAAFPGTGRGLLTLTSTATGQRNYALYAVDSTHLHLIEIDSNGPSVAGDMFSAPGGTANLANGNYVFAGGGNTIISTGTPPAPALAAYAAAGVLVSNGGSITGGVFDANSGGTYNSGPAINSCAYATDSKTGRIDVKLPTGSATCASAPSSSNPEFAVYPTSQGTALMLEIDSAAVSTGIAHLQCVSGAAACPTSLSLPGGSVAAGLTGQGIFHNAPTSYQPDAAGQITLSGTGITGGSLDVNNFSAVFAGDPIGVSGSSIGVPATNGRGTATLALTSPAATYNLIYYLIDDNTALLLDKDSTRVATGVIVRQY